MGSRSVTTEQTPLARPNTAATTSHPLLPPPPAPSMAPPVPLLLPLRCTIQQQRLHILMLAPTPCSGETPAECSSIRQRTVAHIAIEAEELEALTAHSSDRVRVETKRLQQQFQSKMQTAF